MLFLPCLADALGQVQLRPQGDQQLPVQVGKIRRAAGLPEHDLVHPGQHARLVEVERAIWVPEKPDRQFHAAMDRSVQVLQTGSDDNLMSRARQMPRPGPVDLGDCRVPQYNRMTCSESKLKHSCHA